MSDQATKFTQSNKVTHADVQDETILLHIERGEYFGLNAVGRSIWQFLETPHSKADVIGKLVDEYNAEEATIRSDVDRLFDQMQQNGIIVAIE